MPAPSIESFVDLIHAYGDTFRVGVRGQAEIERMIEEGLVAALGPASTLRPRFFGGFERRLDVAIALGVIRVEHKSVIMTSARIRNDLAHGTFDEVPAKRADELLDQVREIYGSLWNGIPEYEQAPVIRRLQLGLAAVYSIVLADLKLAEQRRNEVNQVLEGQAIAAYLGGRLNTIYEALGMDPQENSD